MDDSAVKIILALISIISTLVGGGAAIGFKNSHKNKSLERELGELKVNQENQKDINREAKENLKKSFDKMLDKIDSLSNALISIKSWFKGTNKKGGVKEWQK